MTKQRPNYSNKSESYYQVWSVWRRTRTRTWLVPSYTLEVLKIWRSNVVKEKSAELQIGWKDFSVHQRCFSPVTNCLWMINNKLRVGARRSLNGGNGVTMLNINWLIPCSCSGRAQQQPQLTVHRDGKLLNFISYLALLALNFCSSTSTSCMQSWWNCFLYPRKKRISRMTKSGAVMKAWSQESSSAGARPSNTPCPINWGCRCRRWWYRDAHWPGLSTWPRGRRARPATAGSPAPGRWPAPGLGRGKDDITAQSRQ